MANLPQGNLKEVSKLIGTKSDRRYEAYVERQNKMYRMDRPRAALGVGVKCRGLCFKENFVKGSRYKKGQRYCTTCTKWVNKDAVIISEGKKLCMCCHSKFRTKSPHTKKEFKTLNGNRAFACFNVAFAELQNGAKTLPLYYKISTEAGHLRVEAIRKNIKLARFFLEEMKKYKRQRDVRIDQKYEKIILVVEIMVEKMETTHEKVTQ